jgi:CheY-like chemotaxis protein
VLRVRLVHWNAEEAEERAAILRSAGYRVEWGPIDPGALRRLREKPPAAVVIDLGRIPSHGRDVGVALRTGKATRQVPLVFVGGEPEKVARVRKLLPDAVYTEWNGIASALRKAIAAPPAEPVVPASNLAGYSGTPLPKKLGIGESSRVALFEAPPEFEKVLGDLPPGAKLRRGEKGECDLAIWFVRSRRDLEIGLRRHTPPPKGIWIAWPKKASGVETDVGEKDVRRAGLAAGLVDYKICSIDATWSGLKFTRAAEK